LGYTGRVSEADLKKHPEYLPTDYIGKDGIESQYDSQLKGQNGSERTEVDSARRPIKVLDSREAVPGSSLILTIDRGLQAKLTETLTASLAKSGTRRAAGVAMNPKTGEVLAVVSLPSYDSNQFANGIAPAEYQRLINDSAQPLFNKAISGTYPTGSIIKPLVASAGLQERAITPNTTIDDKGFLEIQNPYNPSITYRFHSYERSGLGRLNLYRAIAMSSNVYFFTVGGGFGDIAGLGVSKLTAWYQRFGLGNKSGIDLPGEATGRVPTPDWKQKTFKEPWYTGDTYNISVGQGDFLASGGGHLGHRQRRQCHQAARPQGSGR
jgi:penicillin-binding protein 2